MVQIATAFDFGLGRSLFIAGMVYNISSLTYMIFID